jgi:hypothetical protein
MCRRSGAETHEEIMMTGKIAGKAALVTGGIAWPAPAAPSEP